MYERTEIKQTTKNRAKIVIFTKRRSREPRGRCKLVDDPFRVFSDIKPEVEPTMIELIFFRNN